MRPRPTGILIGVNVAVFLYSVLYGIHGELVAAYAFNLARLLDGNIAAIIGSAFLHADIGHLLYNMVFLGIFGTVCEDVFGNGRFVLLYLAGIVTGGLFFALLFPSSTAIGASGAVFSCMAAAMLVEPGRPITETVPAPVGLIGVAYLLPALGNAFSLAGGIANIAHVGGAAAGSLLAFLWEPERAKNGVWAVIGFAALVLALGAR